MSSYNTEGKTVLNEIVWNKCSKDKNNRQKSSVIRKYDIKISNK